MNKPLTDWLQELWENHEKPASPSTGQIWTLFHPNQDDLGTVVIVLKVDSKGVHIVLAHDETDYIRGIDIQLSEGYHDYHTSLYVMPDTECVIDKSGFVTGSFLGQIKEKGFHELLEGRKQYEQVKEAQMTLQYQESSDDVSDEQIESAYRMGITRLLPLKATPQEYEIFQERLMHNISLYETLAHLPQPYSGFTESVILLLKAICKKLSPSTQTIEEEYLVHSLVNAVLEHNPDDPEMIAIKSRVLWVIEKSDPDLEAQIESDYFKRVDSFSLVSINSKHFQTGVFDPLYSH